MNGPQFLIVETNHPTHWKMAETYPHHCIYCDAHYNQHGPWPQLPCPSQRKINGLGAVIYYLNERIQLGKRR